MTQNGEDISGRIFGNWTAIKFSHRAHGSLFWRCRCICGTERSLKRGTLIKNERTCCSNTCKYRAIAQGQVGRIFGRLKIIEVLLFSKKAVMVKCKCECGSFKEIALHRVMSGKATSCSYTCRANARATKMIGQKYGRLFILSLSTRSHDNRSAYNCLCDCGKLTKTSRKLLVTGKTKSCGCISVEMNLARRGKNHPQWKGGITPKNTKARNSAEAKTWKQLVFGRDAYTCQSCDAIGGKLAAHHMYNFSQYPEVRFEPSNGITLCSRCHTLFHTIYGKQDNGETQIIEFLITAQQLVIYRRR